MTENVQNSNKNTLAVLASIYTNWRVVAKITGTFAIVAIVISLLLPHRFTASTSLLPSSDSQSKLSTLLGNISGGEGVGSLLSILPPGNTTDKSLKAIMNSRTVAEQIYEQTDVGPVLFKNFEKRKATLPWEEKVRALRNAVQINTNEDGLIWIGVTLRDPEMAAAVANAYPKALQEFLRINAITNAKRNRIFIEGQLQRVEDLLRKTATDFKKFQSEHQVYDMPGQVTISLQTAADLEASLRVKEMELARVAHFSSQQSGTYSQIRFEIDQLKRQIKAIYGANKPKPEAVAKAELEKKKGIASRNGKLTKPLAVIPDLSQRYFELERLMEVEAKVFDLLTEQYELAKISEVREEISFTIVDKAIMPESRSWPARRLIVIASTIVGFMFSLFWVLLGPLLRRDLEQFRLFVRRQSADSHKDDAGHDKLRAMP